MLDNEKIIEKNDAVSCYIMITMTQNFHLQYATMLFPFALYSLCVVFSKWIFFIRSFGSKPHKLTNITKKKKYYECTHTVALRFILLLWIRWKGEKYTENALNYKTEKDNNTKRKMKMKKRKEKYIYLMKSSNTYIVNALNRKESHLN